MTILSKPLLAIWLFAALLPGQMTLADSLALLPDREATFWLGPEELDARKIGIGRQVPDLLLNRIDGRETRLYHHTGSRGTVVVVRDPECPVSRRYGPRLARIADAYGPEGFQFVIIYLNDELKLQRMQVDAQILGIPGTYIGNGSFHLARELGVESTGDVFVMDAAHRLRFRGAVDDQYGLGYTKDAATRNYLRNALDALLKGQPIAVPATNAPGCLIDADPEKDRLFLPITPGEAWS